MKLNDQLVCYFLLAILCVSLTGCGSISRVEPLGNGYEVVAYTRTSISEPEATQITLQYRKPDGGRIMVWPSIQGRIIKNDVAVFAGDKAYKQLDPDDPKATKMRLFAVRTPDRPLDITDEVLYRWSKQSDGNFVELLKKAGFSYAKETNNVLELHFSIWSPPDWPTVTVQMDWNQILDVMREVEEKGVVRKDRVWGTSYIEKEFKPEVQK